MGKITHFGHAAWMIETRGSTILIDPFLDNNPLSPIKSKDIKADYIIITHAHDDHIGDTINIATVSNSIVIANFEISNWCRKRSINVYPMNIGGTHCFSFGKVKLVKKGSVLET